MTASRLEGSDTTAAADKRGRKKLQNRLHQRAFRIRQREKEGLGPRMPRRSQKYQVVRWRLDEEQASSSVNDLASRGDFVSMNSARSSRPDHSEATWFPLPLDQELLHLIQYNVCRGLYKNKEVIQRLTMQYCINANDQTEAFLQTSGYPSYTVILPAATTNLPKSLAPTTIQMNIAHSSWINILPFPKLRETLIRYEFEFDHSELVRDLVGNLINSNLFLSIPPSLRKIPAIAGKQIDIQHQGADDVDGEVTSATAQPSLIVWGEPYSAENWEATPGFIRKWAWALASCQELIDSTNHWRRIRGEDPVHLTTADTSW
ncbi:DUF3425 domain-containing protein [Aspergillus stella-maris]|uniref:DUF3425 domain-containing protein n=1 Tax=Aspergillus stella-maris TaxID=1810926 RepID=UPI003CCCD456